MRLIAKLGWMFRLAAAAVAGAVWRRLRRIARRMPRIWHGHLPLHMTRDQVLADRLAGFPSRSVTVTASALKYALMTERDFDVVLAREGVAPDTIHWRAMIDLHLHADIWNAHFDCLFFPPSQRRRNELALRLVRLAGIRIIVSPHGSDIVQLGREKTRYDWIERMARDYPSWDFAAQTPVSRLRIELFGRYASFIIAADPATARLLDRYDLLFKYFPVTIPETPAIPAGAPARPRIIHAPNHRFVKGTDFLLEAVERVRAAGFDCELVLVEGVPRSEAVELYRTADVIADQFCIGSYGVFAVESLALGKPVLVYLDAEDLATTARGLPLVNATPENLTRVLAAMLAVPELRTRLGEAGRTAAVRRHSPEAIGEVWGQIYRHVWWGEPLRIEEEGSARVFTEDPADETFWPVDVADLMPRVTAIVQEFVPDSE
jgi:glycosyltransferase involved in cell wall biosynthesis